MRYRVFLMIVANSVAAQVPGRADRGAMGPERKARVLQLDPKRLFVEPNLLPLVADVSVIRASLLPPSDRIAVHLAFYAASDPASSFEQTLHLRANTLWPVARIRGATGLITQVSVVADRRGRVRREYRAEAPSLDASALSLARGLDTSGALFAGQHGVVLDRSETTRRGLEVHGRAWHVSGDGRAFSALVHRTDVGYTYDLGKLAGHWLRIDLHGSQLIGLSAVSEG
jgi:hypothetical protein